MFLQVTTKLLQTMLKCHILYLTPRRPVNTISTMTRDSGGTPPTCRHHSSIIISLPKHLGRPAQLPTRRQARKRSLFSWDTVLIVKSVSARFLVITATLYTLNPFEDQLQAFLSVPIMYIFSFFRSMDSVWRGSARLGLYYILRGVSGLFDTYGFVAKKIIIIIIKIPGLRRRIQGFSPATLKVADISTSYQSPVRSNLLDGN